MPSVYPSQIVTLIDRRFPFAAAGNAQANIDRSHASWVAAILGLLDALPSELIAVSGDDYAQYVEAIAGLRSAHDTWRKIGTSEPYDNRTAVAGLITLRRFLGRFPDQGIPATTATLLFITDVSLRESIRIDVASANSALHNGEWKAATVLAGSAVEALLLWAIEGKLAADRTRAINDAVRKSALRRAPRGDPDEWGLHDLIEVAAELGTITGDALRQVRCGKDARNLVHPGKAARAGQVCDRGTALSACAALEYTVRALTP